MTQSDQFELWFGNQSGTGGQALVYQDLANVAFTGQGLQQLAWMVAGANPSVWIRFLWSVDYGFVWSDESQTASFQNQPADLQTANQVTLSHNQFGFLFSAPRAGSPAGTLLVAEDGSIPVANQALAGISMSQAGIFAVAAGPNRNLAFTPAASAALSYQITFGQYDFSVGDQIVAATLNPAGDVTFPTGVTVMTAVLDTANRWSVTSGAPSLSRAAGYSVLTYQAGIGLVA